MKISVVISWFIMLSSTQALWCMDSANNQTVSLLKLSSERQIFSSYPENTPITQRAKDLFDAVINNDTNRAQKLLADTKNPIQVNGLVSWDCKNNFRPILHIAMKNTNASLVKLLLEHGANPYESSKGKFPNSFNYASQEGLIDMAELLIDLKKYAPEIPHIGSNALRYAILPNNIEMTSFLLECGAPILAYDDLGLNSLHHASSLANTQIVTLLLKWIIANAQDTTKAQNNLAYALNLKTNHIPYGPETKEFDHPEHETKTTAYQKAHIYFLNQGVPLFGTQAKKKEALLKLLDPQRVSKIYEELTSSKK